MRYPEADRIREANYAAIMKANADLRAEVAHQQQLLTKTQATVSALDLLPSEFLHRGATA